MDAIVVGAGVIGSGIGLELARSGRDVVVIDRNAGPGNGSTSASSAVIRFHYSTRAGVVTAWESKFGWESWESYLGHRDPAGLARYVPTGGLVLESPGFAVDRVAALYAEVGIPFERLGPQALKSRFSRLDVGRHYPPKALSDDAFWQEADGEIGGLWTPDGGFVDDPRLAAQNLIYAAQKEGAQTMFRSRITRIMCQGSQVRGVCLEDGQEIAANIVVNAAGPHSRQINEMAGVLDDFSVSTRPLRQEVHHVDAPPGDDLHGLAHVSDGDLGTYFRPEPGGGILVGGQEPECDSLTWLVDPDDYNPNATVEVFEAQVTRLARRLPDLAVAPRPSGLAGVYDVSDDWIPIYDHTRLDGYYVAIGTSGNQFKNAPVVGQIMRTLIDACESGQDHDEHPVTWRAPHTHLDVDLSHYSRRRRPNPDSSYSVMG